MHFVTVIIAKMSLHNKWLITLFTSGIYDIVFNGIQGLLCKTSCSSYLMYNRLLMEGNLKPFEMSIPQKLFL